MKQKYILLKDTPELKKGAVFIEECSDGTQDFEVKYNKANEKFFTVKMNNCDSIIYDRKVVKFSKWFREIEIITIKGKDIEVSREQLKKIKKIIK